MDEPVNMAEAEKQRKRQELDDEILLALAVMFGWDDLAADVKAKLDSAREDAPTAAQDAPGATANPNQAELGRMAQAPAFGEIRQKYEAWLEDPEKNPLDFGVLKANVKAAVQAAAAEQARLRGKEYFQVVGVDDEKTCAACKALRGRIFTLTGADPRYPRLSEYLTDEGLHPNCRCYAKAVEPPKMTAKELGRLAMNSKELMEETLYVSLTDNEGQDIRPYDFGESLVMISPVGIFEGTRPDGEPEQENITLEALRTVEANYQGGELLLDVDHRSMKGRESDTKAAGWIYDLRVVEGVGRLDGLYGRVRWTDYGRRLVETREYRFISPVFKVFDGAPFMLINAGLTNRPALETILPILNSKKNDGDIIIMKTEDEKKPEEAVEETKAENACGEEKPTEEKAENACGEEKPTEEKAENACGEEKAEEKPVENSEEKTEEPEEKPEEKTEEPEEEKVVEEPKEEPEVIKLEVLNQQPDATKVLTDYDQKMEKAMSLKGQQFFDYLRTNPELTRRR